MREVVARTALAQVKKMDPSWSAEQRDCAGLVRFAYRRAFRTVNPDRPDMKLWRDRQGQPADFADAESLVQHSFTLLGRGEETMNQVKSGDLVVYRRGSEDELPIYHLMLVVAPADRAHAATLVVYHTGQPQGEMRVGTLRDLVEQAPAEWRPVPSNNSFLGFYRFKDWMP